jgi:GWxTD domain-containing protein
MKFLFLLLFVLNVNAQVEHSRGNRSNVFYPDFELDIADFPSGKKDLTKVDVFIKVPYSNIKFIKTDKGFAGKYTITVTVYDGDKEKTFVEKMWSEKVFAKDFLQAISNNNFNYSYKSFNLVPGDYLIRCDVFDEDSKKTFFTEIKKKVKEFASKLQLSDIVIVADSIKTTEGIKYIPSVSNRFTNNDSTISFFYEIFSTKKQDAIVEYRLIDKNKNMAQTKTGNIALDSGRNVVNYKLSNFKLSLGEYFLEIKLRDDIYNLISESSKKIISKIVGFPSSIMDLDKAIEQMIYISNSEELDKLKNISDPDEKMKAFKDFWKAKDPTPNTEENEILYEYYRRVDYANENFKHYYEGWKTDMGMIYIILGAPSNVERHPFEYDSKPYEIWDYYDINRRFIFIDQTGFGDYRLLNQNYGDWYRYRP